MNPGRRQGFWRLRPLAGFAAAFCFMAAVWLAFGWLPSLCLFLLAGPLWVLADRRTPRFVFAGLVCGLVWTTAWWAWNIRPIEHLLARAGVYTVELSGYAEGRIAYGTAEGRLDYNGRSYKVMLRLIDGSPDHGPGDVLELEGALSFSGLTDGYRSPEGCFLSLRQTGTVKVTDGSPRTLIQHIAVWNRELARQVQRLASGDVAGLLRALLTGDRSDLSASANADLSRAGLTHIIAVSGQHLSILAALLVRLLGQKRGRTVAIPILVMFTAFTGFSPSAVRALIMWCFLFAAWSLSREGDPMTTLLAALLLQAAWDPCALLSVSLQLSFAAVCGLTLLDPVLQGTLPPRRRWRTWRVPKTVARALASGFFTTLSASVFTAPFLLYHFGILSLAAPFSNLLTVWSAGPALVLGGAALLLSYIFLPAARVLMATVRLMIRWMLLVSSALQDVPSISLPGDLLCTWLVAAGLVLTAWSVIRAGWLRSASVTAAATATLLLALLTWNLQRSTDRLILTSENGGLAVTGITASGTFVLDPGPYGNDRMGQRLAEELWQRGISAPELLVATGSHVTRDGALAELFALTGASAVFAPEEAYHHFETVPEQARLLPESGVLELPGGTLQLLYGGREDRSGWLLDLGGFRILSVTGLQARPFLVHNGDTDLSCDMLVLDDAFLSSGDALKTLLSWTSPGALAVVGDQYTEADILRELWTGETVDLRYEQQKIYKIWRKQ